MLSEEVSRWLPVLVEANRAAAKRFIDSDPTCRRDSSGVDIKGFRTVFPR
jgi:hypothetical protein